MPAGLKRALEVALARGGPALVSRAMRGGGVLVLAYHNVVPQAAPPAGERSLHLAADRFKRQLDLIQRWLTVVPVADLAGNRDERRPRAVITFDDAYRGAVTIALAELRDRGLPATMFVAPGRLGGDQFWWDALAADDRGIEPGVRRHALEELGGDESAVRAWAGRAGLALRDVPELWRSATVEELDGSQYPGLTLASHTWSHPNLARCHGSELERELVAPHVWLAGRYRQAYVPWLAFPYGRYSREVCDVAAARGLQGAFTIEGGWTHLPLSNPLAAPRLNIPAGLSIDGFALRVSGMLGG